MRRSSTGSNVTVPGSGGISGGRTSNHAFRLGRYADALPGLLRAAAGRVEALTRSSRRCHAAG